MTLLQTIAFNLGMLTLIVPGKETMALTVLPLGDSITAGYYVDGGYRLALFQRLSSEAYTVNFVGRERTWPSSALPSGDHEGYSGARIEDFIGPLGKANAALNANPHPDFILLMIGTNNLNNDEDPSKAGDLLNKLVADIANLRTGYSPASQLIVASIIQQKNTIDQTKDIAIFNARVAAIVAEHQALGERVSFLDLHSALDASDLADALHPNSNGYKKMGEAWAQAILAILKQPTRSPERK